MTHLDPEPRPGRWRRWLDSLSNDYDRIFSITENDPNRQLTQEPEPEPEPAVEPDLADDLPHVLAQLATAATRAGSPAQQALVAAVADVLTEHRTWLVQHPTATQAERTATAQRAVFRAVQAGIDVVRPNAAKQARRAALEEAAAYVAAQRSVVEAAEGLRRHLDDPTLPARVERYPIAEQAARTTGPLPVVEPVTVVDIN